MLDTLDSDNLYVNVVWSGPEIAQNPPNSEVPAIYDVTRDQPYVYNPADFYASVIRLTIPLDNIPLFIVPIVRTQVGPFNPGLTPYVVSIVYNNTLYPVGPPNNVIWQREVYSMPPYQQNPASYVPSNPFWWMYVWEDLIACVNVAVQVAFAAFAAANPAAPQATKPPPFLVFDPVTQLLSWYWDATWATPLTPNQPYLPLNVPRIVLNEAITEFVFGFQSFFVNPATALNPDDDTHIVFQVTPKNLALVPAPPGSPAGTEYHVSEQGFPTLPAVSSLRRILVTSSSLGIAPELVPSAGSTGRGLLNSPTANTLPIVADFVPQIDQVKDGRSNVYYTPSAQYKLIDIRENSPIVRLQFEIFWEDDASNLYPLQLFMGQQASMKLAFFRKSLYQHVTPIGLHSLLKHILPAGSTQESEIERRHREDQDFVIKSNVGARIRAGYRR